MVGPGGSACPVGVPQEWTCCTERHSLSWNTQGSQVPPLEPGGSGPSSWCLQVPGTLHALLGGEHHPSERQKQQTLHRFQT